MESSTPTATLDRQSGGLSVLSVDGVDGVDDAQRWVAHNRDAIRATVISRGSILIRGLGLRDAAAAGAVFQQLAPAGLLTEKEAFASRQLLSPGVYSSSKWPANQPMCMHHELSYLLEPPILMMFACITPPTTGGATAVADSSAVLRALPGGLVERFEREGWLLTRSYNDELGAPPADAFGTDDPRAIETYCRANRIDFAWQPDGGLRRPVLVQPNRLPQRMDDGPRSARISGRCLWLRRAALQHQVRERRPDRRGRRAIIERRVCGQHRPGTLACR
jgi:hypothetical protein